MESNTKSKPILKFTVLVLVIVVGLFAGYIFNFQRLINEGSNLADEHCIKVNPLIIDRKNKYLEQYNMMMTDSGTSEEFLKVFDDYFVISEKYQQEEGKWLQKQRVYLDSWLFNAMMPQFTKDAGKFQYEMYEADYKSANYLTQSYKEVDKEKQKELSDKVISETAKSKESGDKYNELWDREGNNGSWVYRFIKVPISKCPSENYNIPDLHDLFNPPANTNSPLS